MKTFTKHFEWLAFLVGLLLMATMSPYDQGHSLCFFEWIGFEYCLGDGLGHSIAFLFDGDLKSSLEANFMGPLAVLVLSGRIVAIWIRLYSNYKDQKLGTNYV